MLESSVLMSQSCDVLFGGQMRRLLAQGRQKQPSDFAASAFFAAATMYVCRLRVEVAANLAGFGSNAVQTWRDTHLRIQRRNLLQMWCVCQASVSDLQQRIFSKCGVFAKLA